MDDVNLRKIVGVSSDFAFSLVLIAVSFALGAASVVLLREHVAESIMSIGQTLKISVWLCLMALLFADTACIVMPAARAISVLISAMYGAAAALTAYLYSDLKLFSTEFFLFAAVIFAFTVAITYVSERVFALSIKMRTSVRADRKLGRELNTFNAFSTALVLAAIVSAAAFIL